MYLAAYTKESKEYHFIREHLKEDVRKLALQLHGSKELDSSFVINQISGFQHIVHKIPAWYSCPELLFPRSLSLEQSSSQLTACYKRDLIKSIFQAKQKEQIKIKDLAGCSAKLENFAEVGLRGGDETGRDSKPADLSAADLTGGLGVDTFFLSELFGQFFYVEKEPELCRIAVHNFKALTRPGIQVVNAGSEEYLKQAHKLDFIYVDPSRRDRSGGKLVALQDCSPDVSIIYAELLQKSDLVLLKLSPMMDLSLALKALPHTTQIHVLSVDNDCKEVLFLLEAKRKTTEPEITAVNLRKNADAQVYRFTRSSEAKASCAYCSRPGKYLYEPNASVLKAGAFVGPAQEFGMEKLHKNSHLYTSDTVKPAFPGKIFEIKAILAAKPREFHKQLPDLLQANLVVRNFPVGVDALRKKLALKEGGRDYVFASTLADESKVFIHGKRIINNFL